MATFADLAKRLESLAGVTAEALHQGAAYADQRIRRAGTGRKGFGPTGPLFRGNAIVARVSERGTSLDITRIHSTKGGFPYGIRNDYFARWIVAVIQTGIAKRFK